MTDREKLIDIINTACEGYAENLMQPYGAEVLADYLIANGARISPWISVKDRLPERGVFVAVYYGNFIGELVDTFMWDGECWRNANAFIEDSENITHWMPLPEPPKEADDANR